MCEASAYLEQGGQETLLLGDVELLKVEKDRIDMWDIFGEKKSVTGCIKEINFTTHKIIIEGQENP